MIERDTRHLLADVHLRDVVTSDLPQLFQQQLDPDANRLAAVHPRDSESFHAHWANILSDRSVVAKAILVRDAVVGYVSCFKMDGQDAVGYWIAKEHWGRGIATRALALLLEQVAIRPLHARVARHNVASIRVLERCGFAITGSMMSPDSERYCACEELTLLLS